MTDDSANVACIILNWNGGQDTARCIDSVLKVEGVRVEILLLDNGSTDGSAHSLAEAFPQITLQRNARNEGVARAWNAGVRWALEKGMSHVFFLNNDCVVEPACLERLVSASASAPGAAIVSPRILDGSKEGQLWFDGGVVNRYGDPVHRHLGRRLPAQTPPAEEDFATGCAMLVDTPIFKEVGLFDETYFAYSEDADFCLRAKKLSFTIMHVSEAVVTHFPSQSIIRNKGKWFRDYYVTRNKLFLARKHLRGARWFLFLLYFTIKYLIVPIAYSLATVQLKRIGGVALGAKDFVVSRCGERFS